MNRLAALSIVATTLAAGCLQEQPGDAVSEALPTAQNVRVNLPADAGEQPAALGELSSYYALTRGISREFNRGAASVLLVVHAIVQYPPTTVDGNTYTWGPGSDALDPADYRLVVTDNMDGSYDWHLDGKSKLDAGADFLVVVEGHAVAGSEPHRGSGDFSMDFDVAKELDPIEHANSNGGVVSVIYDLENRDGTQASLDLHIDGFDDDGNAIVADYRYAENQDRSGDFQFSLPADVDEDGSAVEDVVLRSRWLADGSGRGDARVTGGDVGGQVVEASECWGTDFHTVYYTDSHGILPTEGDASSCAFATADLPELP